MSETMPDDIVEAVTERFINETDQHIVLHSLHKLWLGGLNVPPAQLARAIIFLADGDLARFSALRAHFLGDPRDLLIHANRRFSGTDFWFNRPLNSSDRPGATAVSKSDEDA